MILEVIWILTTIVGMIAAGLVFGLSVIGFVKVIDKVGGKDDVEEHLRWLEKKERF